MKLKHDFYFWSSWILLGCLFLLIFYMYQYQYNFKEIIDLKTILTVLGTIFGAYFGAKTAGQYAVKSVEKQIDHQKNSEIIKEKRILKKKMQEIITRCAGLSAFLNDMELIFEENEDYFLSSKDTSILLEIQEHLEIEISYLKSIELTEVYEKPFLRITLVKSLLDFILSSTKLMARFVAEDATDIYFTEKESFFDSILGFEEGLENLKMELNNI
ncbi:hypothetical protein [Planococcus beigongshangi]|uniref:hypothetical protein n=1 Tax=Planococcus beigongshangi TaxID=2782536 RepID=UPI00193C7AD8|nr:hypothetical protein [Planococcus beigongshangi]